MIEAPVRVVPLAAAHDRTGFDSDSEPLDRYFRLQVSQDIRRRVTACFVALTPEWCIAGYYTLASASLLLADLSAATANKLPRYPSVPAVRMGRLAVDRAFHGQGLGGALLADTFDRAARAESAAYALVVEAKPPGQRRRWRLLSWSICDREQPEKSCIPLRQPVPGVRARARSPTHQVRPESGSAQDGQRAPLRERPSQRQIQPTQHRGAYEHRRHSGTERRRRSEV
jgi:GNAT superfamily N-acetyltransferase